MAGHFHHVGVLVGTGEEDARAKHVVERRGLPAAREVLVVQAGVDDIGRLALQGALVVPGHDAGAQIDLAFDERSIENGRDVLQTVGAEQVIEEAEIFPHVQLHPVGKGAGHVGEGVSQVGAGDNDVLNRIGEIFVEHAEMHLLAGGGVPLVAQVEVVDGGHLQRLGGVEVQRAVVQHVEVEIVVVERGRFAELGAVEAAAVAGAEQAGFAEIIAQVGRGQQVVGGHCLVHGRTVHAGVDDLHVALEAGAGEQLEAGRDGNVEGRVHRFLLVAGRVAVSRVDVFAQLEAGAAHVFGGENRGQRQVFQGLKPRGIGGRIAEGPRRKITLLVLQISARGQLQLAAAQAH